MPMTIGQVASHAGVNVQTIRYYERRGLIPEPDRTQSGYRRYPEEAVRRVGFIKRAQELGFSLNETSDLLKLRVRSATACATVEKRARSKIAVVEETIADLVSANTDVLRTSRRVFRSTQQTLVREEVLDRIAGRAVAAGQTRREWTNELERVLLAKIDEGT